MAFCRCIAAIDMKHNIHGVATILPVFGSDWQITSNNDRESDQANNVSLYKAASFICRSATDQASNSSRETASCLPNPDAGPLVKDSLFDSLWASLPLSSRKESKAANISMFAPNSKLEMFRAQLRLFLSHSKLLFYIVFIVCNLTRIYLALKPV